MKEYADLSEEQIELYYKHISAQIKKIRLEKKYTQEEVALSMGFTTATFYTNAENFRRGKHFNLEHIIKISKILGVPISIIFDGI